MRNLWAVNGRRPWVIGIGIYLVVSVIAILFLPDFLVDLTISSSSKVSDSQRLVAVASARQSVLLAAGGVLAVITLFLTISRDEVTKARADRESDEHVTSMYVEALRQLSDRESAFVRIGGIHALERITQDSARDQQAVMSVLASFLREHGSRPVGTEEPPNVPADVAAAAEVLGRVTGRQEPESRLELDSVNFFRLRLRGASFAGANMNQLFAKEVILDGATLTSTGLYSAQLRSANFRNANLSHAGLDYADLSGAYLVGANLTGANLTGAKLYYANLKDAVGLTSDQVASAHGWSEQTRWPDYLEPPEAERNIDDFQGGHLAFVDLLND